MYVLSVKGKNFQELKEKLLEAAININVEKVAQDQEEDIGLDSEPFEEEEILPMKQSAPPMKQSAPGEAPATDSKGNHWDERIHSSTKAITGKGEWRTRRNIDPSYVSHITNQTKTPQAIANVVVPLPPAIPAMPIAQPVVVEKVYENIIMPSGDVKKQAHDVHSFRETLTESIAKMIKNKQITKEYLNELKKFLEIDEIWEVKDDQTKLQTLFDTLAQYGIITKVGPQ